MKKLLSIPICLLLLVNCSCSSKGKKEKEPDFKTLDASWECDYLKLNVNSNWEQNDSLSGDSTFASWNWTDANDYHSISFSVSHNSMYHKLTQSELISSFEESKSFFLNDDEFKNDKIMLEAYEDVEVSDSFVKNGQAYIVLEKTDNDYHKIKFEGESITGDFRYNISDEQIVLDIIDTLVFY